MIAGIPIGNLTSPGLVGIAVVMILTGLLIPRRVYRDKSEECDRWRKAFETSEEARRASDSQTAELLEVARTTHALITAVLANSDVIRKAGEPNVVS